MTTTPAPISTATSRAPLTRRAIAYMVAVLVVVATAVTLVASGTAHELKLWVAAINAPAPTPLPATESYQSSQLDRSARANVHALGRLEPKGRVVRLAQPSGNDGARVETLLVDEGDDVAADQIVARLDTYARKQALLAEADARAAAARGKLAQIKAGAKQGDIEAAREAVALFAEQLAVATKELERASRLVDKKTITVEEFDNKKWSRDRLVIEHRRAVQQLASISEVRETDVRAQELEIATADAAVDSARENLKATEVRAPTAGRVLKIHTRPGEKTGDQGLLEIGAVARMQAVAEVFEGDVSRIAVGQSAEIIVDGTGEKLPGRVVALGQIVGRKVVLTNDPVSDTDARVLEIRIDIDPASISKVQRLSNARVEVMIDITAAPPVTR
jgi:HlyD family secretion protein